ncbi:MAG: hypothetical protein KDI88_14050 [Gammaproteobacteria bacterium]|nr:hypothetical protein [Gammaproteobacteria bacterium]
MIQAHCSRHPWLGSTLRCLSSRYLGLLPWCLAGILATAPALASDDNSPQFREPGSGHRVSRYTIELDAGNGNALSYRVPDDCARLIAHLDAAPHHWATPTVRQAWRKVEADCRYYQLLHNGPRPPLTDHVSSFDFMNAPLDQLPVTVLEDGPAAMSPRQQPGQRTGIVEHLPLAKPGSPAAGTPVTICRLRDGLLRGDVFIDDGGTLRCSKGDRRPTLRLISVDFADIDGDQVTDAILRFVFLRPGMPRGPMILPVTRDRPDAAMRTIRFQGPGAGADTE